MTAAAIPVQPVRGRAVSLSVVALLGLDIGLGGAVRGAAPFNLTLQLVACAVLIWCVAGGSLHRAARPALWLLGLLLAAVLVGLLQLLPMPFSIWSTLPGRAAVAEGFRILGAPEVDMPLSLSPLATVEALLWLLPPAAIFVLAAKLDWRALVRDIRWAVPILAGLSALLGIAQIVAPDSIALYLQNDARRGFAAGVFQVVNHQATLQLMAIPFLAVLVARLGIQFSSGDAYQGLAISLVTIFLILLAGIVASESVAGYAMVLPVVLASVAIALRGRPGLLQGGAILVCFVGLGVAGYVLANSHVLAGAGSTDFGSGSLSRRDGWDRAVAMARDYFPAGSGLGSFREAFGSYEDPATVTNQFVSHAHNDYLELVVELGAAGCVLLAGVVLWWIVMTFVIWRSPAEEGVRIRKAASVAVGVVLLHSLVDSPARTEAIACLTALCLGLMASRPQDRADMSTPITTHRHIDL